MLNIFYPENFKFPNFVQGFLSLKKACEQDLIKQNGFGNTILIQKQSSADF